MITHIVAYKFPGFKCWYVKCFESLEKAEIYLKANEYKWELWSIDEVTGFHAVTGEAEYKLVRNSESEE